VVGSPRALVAVLATAAAVLAFGQSISNGGVVNPRSPDISAPAASDPPSPGRTDRTSVSDAGAQAPHGGGNSVISGDGRWDVFTSTDDLAGVTNGGQSNVYARDLVNGRTVQLSGGSNGSPPPVGDVIQPSISDNGRFVSYILVRPTLSVSRTGAGTGTVTSGDGAINCGPTCSAQYDSGSTVTLTASPASNSTFAGWSGGGCSGTGSCTVTVTATTTVTATFALLPQSVLTVTKVVASAGGTATITSSPAGINCGGTCTASFNTGTTVTLTATPAGGFHVTWSGGGCSGTSTCVVTLAADTTVTATISLNGPAFVGPNFGTAHTAAPKFAAPHVAAPHGAAPHAAVAALAAAPDGTEIVVCDRDPDGNGIFDQATPADVCVSAYSAAATGAGSIRTSDPPRLAADGSRIVWTQQRSDSFFDTGAFFTDLLNANGALQTPAGETQVPMLVPNPAVNICGAVTGGAQASESEPLLTQDAGHVIMTVAFPNADGCSGIVDTTLATQNQAASSVRVDAAPPGCGGGFLGDRQALVGPCQGFTGDDSTFVDQPEAASSVFAGGVVFHFHDGPSQINFSSPVAALAPTTDTDWVLLARRGFPDYSSQIVSRGSAGNVINATNGTISGDGRYVAFGTSDSDPGLFTPPAGVGAQVIARDVITNTDALVTPSAATCTTALPCGSTGGSVSNISVDSFGTRIGYDSTATDLVSGDTNNATDAFVRTWQPTVSNGTANLGAVQVGTSAIVNLQTTVSGFGAVEWDSIVIGGSDEADFAIIGSNCRVADRSIFSPGMHDGETCVVSLRFSPTTLGPKTATVSLSSTQFDTPQQMSTVQATATAEGPVAAPADNTRTSVRNNGTQSPTGGDGSMISGNGRWQVFVSDSNLAGHSPVDPANTGRSNIFVRDLADPQHTVQISLHTAATVNGNSSVAFRPVAVNSHPTGASPNSDSFEPSISSDGRFVSFMTTATDIVPSKFLDDRPAPDTFRWTVVVCDRDPDRDGIFDEVQPGTKLPNYRCFAVESGSLDVAGRSADEFTTPRLAGNGTRITWVEDDPRVGAQRAVVSRLLNAPGDVLQPPSDPAYVPINGADVPGFTASATGPNQGDALQANPRLTRDGGTVVFSARQGGNAAVIETTLSDGSSLRFDTTDNGATFLGDGGGNFDPPALSDDGTRVAFAFRGTTDAFSQVYVATRTSTTPTTIDTVLASVDDNGAPSAGNEPALSGDGRYLAFQTSQPQESNAVDPPNGSCFVNDTNANVNCQIVARDLVKDAAQRAANLPLAASEIVSSRGIDNNCPNPLPPGRKCGSNGFSSNPSVDETGSEIGFDSDSSDIVPGDTNEIDVEGPEPATDAFVHTWRPTLTATPSFDFGTHLLGTHKDKTFTVTESGFGPISLGATSITGLNSTDFKVLSSDCAGKTLNDTQTCTFELRFKPLLKGNRTATLAIAVGKNGYPRHNPDNTISYDPALLATLTGVGLKQKPPPPTLVAQATINPTTLDFGKRLPLAPRLTKTVTVTDTGTGSLKISDVVLQDTTHPGASGDYKVDPTDCLGVLQPGKSCAITVGFRGRAVGNRGAQLVITDDTPTPTSTVTLLATVPKPTITANPGVTPPGRVTTISGTGFAPGKVVDVTLKGFGESATAKADKHGVFEVGLVIFRNTPEGPQTVLAHTRGVDKSISADEPLLLAVGSVDILSLVTRH
jgi:hypothetical protein